MKKFPLIYVIILVFNGKKNLEYNLPSLFATKYQKYKVLLIDNGSTDDSVEFTKRNFPKVEIIKNKKNMYFSAGSNMGIKYSLQKNADYIVLLNDDTLVDGRWLTEAVKVSESDKNIGMIEFDIVEYQSNNSLKQFNKAKILFRKTKVEPVENITGCCMFIRSQLFLHVGFLDEFYKSYAEETDLVRRAKKAGYKLVKINVPVFHYGGATSSKYKLKTAIFCTKNMIRMAIKNDNLFNIFKMILFVANVSSNPFYKGIKNSMTARLRTYNFLINFLIFIYAIFWNIVFLPQTLYSKYEDYQKIAKSN